MNTTTRTALRLLVATPIAVSAIAFGSGVAHADGFEPNGPIVIANPDDDGPKGPGDIANPEPEPQPDPPAPEPQGPGDIANPEDDGPKGPGDIANPEDDPKPEGPGDITNPEDDDPKPEGPDDLAIPEPGDQPEDKPADKGGKDDKDVDVVNTGGLVPDYDDAADVPVPTRIDAGAASATEDEGGLQLMWVLAGGGVVTAAGAAFARQRLARR